MARRTFSVSEKTSVVKIQGAFRQHQARLKLKERTAWDINEKLEYLDEQTEAKLRKMFEVLLETSQSRSPAIAKALQKLQAPVDEEELWRSTNPNNTHISADYQGARIDGPITEQVFLDLIKTFQREQILHQQYVFKILHEARAVLRTLPNCNDVNLSKLGHVTVVGDLHGQLADLLHIFNHNGLPSADTAFLFNGDFVDRGKKSVEVVLLLLVALILYPTSVFLNRGNHEDTVLNRSYTFLDEIKEKYPEHSTPLLELFSHVFNWLPLYSIIETGVSKIIVMHGGISNRIDLSQLEKLPRDKYVSIVVRPEPTSGNEQLTDDELKEYHQVKDLLWSDPNPDRKAKGCHANTARQTACFFSADATEDFLQKYGFAMIIRSHQVKPEGYQYRHGGKLLTIFSASNYGTENNKGAVIRWELNSPEPKIITHKIQSGEMENLSIGEQVKQIEDPAYQQLTEKIVANKKSLLEAFEQADDKGNGHISLTSWESIMSNSFPVDLPWRTMRSRLVQVDSEGVAYRTMFQNHTLTNSKLPISNTEMMANFYQWKDILLAIFRLIDTANSGSIDREEFTEIVRFLTEHQKIDSSDLDGYVDELTNALDSDKNGRIDFQEFFEAFKLVSVK